VVGGVLPCVNAGPAGSASGRSALRDLVIPNNLWKEFGRLAMSNTEASSPIETLGYLLGGEVAGHLCVTVLYVPSQTGTSHSCEATCDATEAMTHFVELDGLRVLGWIHVSARQTRVLLRRSSLTPPRPLPFVDPPIAALLSLILRHAQPRQLPTTPAGGASRLFDGLG
jgi:hypothetical protein